MDKTDTLASLNHNITINERKNIVRAIEITIYK